MGIALSDAIHATPNTVADGTFDDRVQERLELTKDVISKVTSLGSIPPPDIDLLQAKCHTFASEVRFYPFVKPRS